MVLALNVSVPDESVYAAGALGLVLNVTRGLRGVWYPGVTAAKSIANRYSTGAGDASVVGSPTYASTYATLTSGTNYLQTPVAETGSFTAMLVVRSGAAFAAAGTRPVFLGNNADGGIALYVSATSGSPQATLTLSARYTTAAATDGAGGTPYIDATATPLTEAVTSIAVTDMSAWHLICVRVTAGTGRSINDLTRGVSGNTSLTSTRLLGKSIPNLRLGNGGRSDYLGTQDMAAAVLANVAWTDAEMNSVAAQIRSFMAGRGITI